MLKYSTIVLLRISTIVVVHLVVELHVAHPLVFLQVLMEEFIQLHSLAALLPHLEEVEGLYQLLQLIELSLSLSYLHWQL